MFPIYDAVDNGFIRSELQWVNPNRPETESSAGMTRSITRIPLDPLHAWIDEQHQHGIALKLVGYSAIASEPGLTADVGIYGNRAVGYQELDDHSRRATNRRGARPRL